MNPQHRKICPDCDASLDRRTFIRTVGGAALAGAAAPVLLGGRFVPLRASAVAIELLGADLLAARRRGGHNRSPRDRARTQLVGPMDTGLYYDPYLQLHRNYSTWLFFVE